MKFDLTVAVFDDATVRLVQIATPGQQVEILPLGQLLMQLLLSNPPGQAAPAPDVKVKHYQLMTKILAALDDKAAAGKVDLTLSEIGMIKELADVHCPTLVHGRLSAILENPLSG